MEDQEEFLKAKVELKLHPCPSGKIDDATLDLSFKDVRLVDLDDLIAGVSTDEFRIQLIAGVQEWAERLRAEKAAREVDS